MKDQTSLLCEWMSTTTEEEWVSKLQGKSLEWLLTQEILKDSNGLNYYKALQRCIREKYKSGEEVSVKKRKLWSFIRTEEENEDVVIQHLPTGPKGQTTRVVVPRHCCAD